MISIKTKFEEQVRRFTVSSDSNLCDLKELLAKLYTQLPDNVLLEYSLRGSNSSSMEINSDKDLQQAISTAQSNPTSLLYINVKKEVNRVSRESSSASFVLLRSFSDLIQQFVQISLNDNTDSEKSEIDNDDALEQMCSQLNELVIEEMPEKKEALKKFNLAHGNSNEPCSDKERRANFKKLVDGPMPYKQVTASGIDPKEQAMKGGNIPAKKKRPVFRKSCRDCGEPMDKEDGEFVCNNFRCN